MLGKRQALILLRFQMMSHSFQDNSDCFLVVLFLLPFHLLKRLGIRLHKILRVQHLRLFPKRKKNNVIPALSALDRNVVDRMAIATELGKNVCVFLSCLRRVCRSGFRVSWEKGSIFKVFYSSKNAY